MPSSCSICHTVDHNLRMITVPKIAERLQRWKLACGIELRESSKICQNHFQPDDFKIFPNSNRQYLKKGVVPTLLLTLPTKKVKLIAPNQIRHDVSVQTDIDLYGRNRAEYTEVSVQTIQEEMQCGVILENLSLKQQLRKSDQQIKKLQKQLDDVLKAHENMRTIFTDAQVRKLANPNKRIRWGCEDISSSIEIQAAGPNAYRLLCDKGYPLPCISTLQKWKSQSVQKQIINLMENFKLLTQEDKLCVLSFDEMKVASIYEHDPQTDMVKKKSNHFQVAMVRGLSSSWKQPIFFDYDCKVTKSLLFTIVQQLRTADFTVKAIVSDMSSYKELWKELGVSADQSWFKSLGNTEEKIFVCADLPHLQELIDNGIIISH